jgi:hypothetical protein
MPVSHPSSWEAEAELCCEFKASLTLVSKKKRKKKDKDKAKRK